jgi:hypothetical protein
MDSGIPDSFRDLWEYLESEVTWLHGRWKIYRQLYGTSPERIDLLNKTASAFFYIVENTLFDGVVLALSRLTDPATKGSQDNAVLEQLLRQPEIMADAALIARLTDRLQQLRDKCTEFRKIRNKRIGHNDLSIALKATSLPPVSREMVEGALLLLREFMNDVQQHFTGSVTAYEHFAMMSDGEALIYRLRQAQAYERAVLEGLVPWDHLEST